MDQSATEQPVPLPPLHGGRVKDELVHHPLVAERGDGNQGADDDDDEGDGDLHQFIFFSEGFGVRIPLFMLLRNLAQSKKRY